MLAIRPVALVFVLLTTADFTHAVSPATVADAQQRLDLTTLPLPAGAVLPGYRREAELSYHVKLPPQEAFNFAHKQIVDRGWKQMPDAQNYGDFINANYQLDGFTVYLSVSPRQEGRVSVMLTHKGNIDLEDVPVPSNVTKMHAFPAIVMYKSSDGVQQTAAACRDAMIGAGWSSYGGAGDVQYYRQNAVQVDVGVQSAPAQGGATVISISSKLLSLEVPAPPFAEDFRYSDSTTAIDFDTEKSPQEVADFYRGQLGPRGWKSTTDEPVEIRWKKYTIFRTESQEMITIETHDFEGRTRVSLDHQNAAEVANEELRAKIAFGEKAKYRDVKWQTVKLGLEEALAVVKLEDWAIKIPTAKEQSFATASRLVEALQSEGWTLDGKKPIDQPVIRSYRLQRGDRILSILALRHHKLPSWVAAVGIGGVNLDIAQ